MYRVTVSGRNSGEREREGWCVVENEEASGIVVNGKGMVSILVIVRLDCVLRSVVVVSVTSVTQYDDYRRSE